MKNEDLFKWLFLINFAVNLGFGLADAFFSTYLFNLGGRSVLLGLPLLSFSLSKILLSPVMGALSDRVGARRAVTLSIALYLVVSCGYLASRDLVFITVLRLVQGGACAMFRPVMLSLVRASSCASERGRATGTFEVSFYGALAVGPVLGGVLHDTWGFPGVFAGLASTCLLALGIALWRVPDLPLLSDRRAGVTLESSLPAVLDTVRHGTMRALLFFIFGRACGISLLACFFPILLSSRLGLTGIQTGVVLASTTLVTTCLLRPAGVLSDRVSPKSLVVLGGITVSLLYFLIPVAQGFCQVLLLGGGIGLCSVLSQPASTSLLLEQGERHGTGLAVGVFNAVLNLGFAVGPLFGAWMESRFGLSSVFQAAGWIGLIAVGICAGSMTAREKRAAQ